MGAAFSLADDPINERECRTALDTKPMSKFLDWKRIAECTGLQNGETARGLVQAIFAMAVSCEHEGHSVTLDLRIGRLMFVNSDIQFTSKIFGNR